MNKSKNETKDLSHSAHPSGQLSTSNKKEKYQLNVVIFIFLSMEKSSLSSRVEANQLKFSALSKGVVLRDVINVKKGVKEVSSDGNENKKDFILIFE